MSQLLATMFGVAPKFTIIKKETRKFGNNTDKADSLYLDALKDGPLSVKELSTATGRKVASVQRQVRIMESRELIEIVDRVPNKANPRILWGIK